jgi:hypothetical protein
VTILKILCAPTKVSPSRKTLWFFQASLFDLSSNPNTDSFQICQRVFNQCQRILYDDPLAETEVIASSYSGSSANLGSRVKRRLRIKAMSIKGERVLPSNVLPCFLGMGMVLASVPAMPSLAPLSGKMAIEQGRRRPQGRDRQPLEGSGMQMIKANGEADDSDEDVNGKGGIDYDDEDEDDDDDDDIDEEDEPRRNGETERQSNDSRNNARTAIIGTNAQVLQPVMRKPQETGMHPQAAKKRLPSGDASNPLSQLTSGFNELKGKATAAVNDVFGQMGVDFAPGTHTKDQSKGPVEPPLWHPQPRHRSTKSAKSRKSVVKDERRSSEEKKQNRYTSSVPNLISASRRSISSSPFASSATLIDESMQVTPEAILARYDNEARRRLLRSNYCRKQTNFLQTLQDISARLLILPKPARLSALRAELTELNHTLPSEVCFPLWCRAEVGDGQENSDAKSRLIGSKSKARSGRHHRVVRINPSEAVVLNSADRVPYLLHVEVLVDDLDFDTERRQNRESLKKLVMQEDVRRRKTAIARHYTELELVEGTEPVEGKGEAPQTKESAPATLSVSPLLGLRSRLATPPLTTPEEEKDEGTNNRIVDVPPEAEEEVDLTEQAYGHDLSGFGEEKEGESSDEDDLATMNVMHDNAAWAQAQSRRVSANSNAGAVSSVGSTPHRRNGSLTNGNVSAGKKKDFSLDEYAERMRTAAIMLAQLNQSTNAAAHPIIASNPHVSSTAQGGWSSWVIGTSWAASTAQPGKKSESGQGSAGVKAPISTAAATTSNGASSSADTPLKAASMATRSAAGSSRLMHTDTESIRKRIMQEMMALEEERMERMKTSSNRKNRRSLAGGVEDEMTVQRAVNKDDPSAAMFRESWSAKKARIRASSPYGHFDNWDVFSVIVKTGADLRQEQLAIQLIQEFGRIWKDTGSKCWVRYFKILVTSENSGIMETITDAVSVHSIKKEAYSRNQAANQEGKIATYSLLDHFVNTFGDPSSSKFNKARQNFLESLAAYSIISYLLHLKDRHNGNLLIDQEGHLIHIDFGFMLGISPGGVGFEAAPFKMPQEYIDILGGQDSAKFAEFKTLVCQGFRDVRKHAERIIMMVELMQKDSKLPCFALGELTANYLRDRFQLALSQTQLDEFVDKLIVSSMNSTFTRLYDQYQYYSEGIL